MGFLELGELYFGLGSGFKKVDYLGGEGLGFLSPFVLSIVSCLLLLKVVEALLLLNPKLLLVAGFEPAFMFVLLAGCC